MSLKQLFLMSFFFIFLSTSSLGYTGINQSEPNGIADDKWSITLFNGIYTNRTIGEASFNIPGNFESNYIHGLSISREFWKTEKHFSFEWEAMFAKHHGKHKTGNQNYEEYILAFLVRYHTFPWDHIVDTSFAVGEGLSWTSEIPERESQRGDQESQRLLNYLAFEFAFTLPRYPKASLVYRIHHRSGVFGLFGGMRGASDFYMLGLRYNF